MKWNKYREKYIRLKRNQRLFDEMEFLKDRTPKAKRYINTAFWMCLFYYYNICLCRFKVKAKKVEVKMNRHAKTQNSANKRKNNIDKNCAMKNNGMASRTLGTYFYILFFYRIIR